MTKGNISIYISVADTARLEELGHDPRVWARDTIKSALGKLEGREHEEERPLTDEENQMLEESNGPPSALPEIVTVDELPEPEIVDDWLARLRQRAGVEG